MMRALCFTLLIMVMLLAGCGTTGSTPKATKPSPPASSAPTSTSSTLPGKPGGYYQDDGPLTDTPANLDRIPDAVPREERYHSGANRPYTVFGRTYVPTLNNDAFRQSGVASWYGKKFHGNMTSIGETYDMFAMTAAHPTLPLPSYVRVTNPAMRNPWWCASMIVGLFMRIASLIFRMRRRIGSASYSAAVLTLWLSACLRGRPARAWLNQLPQLHQSLPLLPCRRPPPHHPAW
jgi:Lytic transglycolase